MIRKLHSWLLIYIFLRLSSHESESDSELYMAATWSYDAADCQPTALVLFF